MREMPVFTIRRFDNAFELNERELADKQRQSKRPNRKKFLKSQRQSVRKGKK